MIQDGPDRCQLEHTGCEPTSIGIKNIEIKKLGGFGDSIANNFYCDGSMLLTGIEIESAARGDEIAAG